LAAQGKGQLNLKPLKQLIKLLLELLKGGCQPLINSTVGRVNKFIR